MFDLSHIALLVVVAWALVFLFIVLKQERRWPHQWEWVFVSPLFSGARVALAKGVLLPADSEAATNMAEWQWVVLTTAPHTDPFFVFFQDRLRLMRTLRPVTSPMFAVRIGPRDVRFGALALNGEALELARKDGRHYTLAKLKRQYPTIPRL
mgnify:CR=1 FL=1